MRDVNVIAIECMRELENIGIKCCDSADEKGISEEQKEKIQTERAAARKVKYIFKCTCCGQKVERCRESKFIKYPELYRCAVCHGKFERIF